MMNLFKRRRAARPALRVVADNQPAAIAEIGAMLCANDVFEMAQLHPSLRVAGKLPKATSFLVGKAGALYEVSIKCVR